MGLKERLEGKFGDIYIEMIDSRRKAPTRSRRNNFGTSPELEWQIRNKYYSILKDLVKDGEAFGCNFGKAGEQVKHYVPAEPSNFE